MNKQLVARLLVLAMTLCMVGCGSDGADNADNTYDSDSGGADIQSTADNAETVDPLDDNLPDVDYDGYKFRILAADNDVDMVYVDELNGSPVNDAVFNANKSVETRFNIELVHVPLSSWNDSNFISSSIMSGSDDFDVGDNGFQRMLNTLIPSDTLEFASYYAQNEASQQAVLDEINEFYSSGTAVE